LDRWTFLLPEIPDDGKSVAIGALRLVACWKNVDAVSCHSVTDKRSMVALPL